MGSRSVIERTCAWRGARGAVVARRASCGAPGASPSRAGGWRSPRTRARGAGKRRYMGITISDRFARGPLGRYCIARRRTREKTHPGPPVLGGAPVSPSDIARAVVLKARRGRKAAVLVNCVRSMLGNEEREVGRRGGRWWLWWWCS